MKYLVALFALAMPVVAWLSNTGMFGPTNGAISDRYPTLIVAAGYAFAIWGPIFLLDLIYAIRQLFDRRPDERLRRIRPWTAAGFALTTTWMIVFTLQWFWLALVIIWASLACLLYAAWQVSHTAHHARSRWWQWLPLSLHAGWVSLAVFLNVAQVIVAFRLFPTTQMLPWTLVLFAFAAVLLLATSVRLRGNPWYALAAVWGLVGIFAKQHASTLAGAAVAAWVALGLAAVVVVTSLWQQIGASHPGQPRIGD
ncbi:hypothetical protein [Rhodanobacter sp. DHB23]|uniref:hypothetical protein n=1 Tax=Rhodanobacter sp. DHB23 TaxID=2775923 RepID=UPI0017822EC5|nr:hypothetical protein [Rhodanobacter sp. DHB23]MBD8873715.1 hypothetical protein [Rhodanobacter sp. DHB23]